MPTLTNRRPLMVVLAEEYPSKACDPGQAVDRCEPQPEPEQRSAGLAHS